MDSSDRGIHVFRRPLGLVLFALYKGVWGTLEVVAGLLVLFSYQIFSRELIEDPQDLFVNWLFNHLGVEQAERVGAVIILLGGVKILIAIGLWYRSWRIRKVALVFLGAAALYALYEIASHFTVFRLAALGMDLVLIYYFWKILPKHLRHGAVV
jgi:uncharacterized membrane protein